MNGTADTAMTRKSPDLGLGLMFHTAVHLFGYIIFVEQLIHYGYHLLHLPPTENYAPQSGLCWSFFGIASLLSITCLYNMFKPSAALLKTAIALLWADLAGQALHFHPTFAPLYEIYMGPPSWRMLSSDRDLANYILTLSLFGISLLLLLWRQRRQKQISASKAATLMAPETDRMER